MCSTREWTDVRICLAIFREQISLLLQLPWRKFCAIHFLTSKMQLCYKLSHPGSVALMGSYIFVSSALRLKRIPWLLIIFLQGKACPKWIRLVPKLNPVGHHQWGNKTSYLTVLKRTILQLCQIFLTSASAFLKGYCFCVIGSCRVKKNTDRVHPGDWDTYLSKDLLEVGVWCFNGKIF